MIRRQLECSHWVLPAAAAAAGALAGGEARTAAFAGAGAGAKLDAATGFLAAPGQFAWTTWLQSSPSAPKLHLSICLHYCLEIRIDRFCQDQHDGALLAPILPARFKLQCALPYCSCRKDSICNQYFIAFCQGAARTSITTST